VICDKHQSATEQVRELFPPVDWLLSEVNNDPVVLKHGKNARIGLLPAKKDMNCTYSICSATENVPTGER
jgi:hypothetical protein